MQWIIDLYHQALGLVNTMGYLGIFIMMTIESSFIPFPSEAAMIPAGILSQQGKMNFLFAFLAGTSGAWLGATINYILGYYLGGPVVKNLVAKYGKYFHIKMELYEKTEKYFQENGGKTTFFGRFIPGVRQIISIPAGIFKMNFWTFSLFTILGAGLWNIFLMIIGYFFADQEGIILLYFKEIVLVILAIAIVYFGYKYWKKKKAQKSEKVSEK